MIFKPTWKTIIKNLTRQQKKHKETVLYTLSNIEGLPQRLPIQFYFLYGQIEKNACYCLVSQKIGAHCITVRLLIPIWHRWRAHWGIENQTSRTSLLGLILPFPIEPSSGTLQDFIAYMREVETWFVKLAVHPQREIMLENIDTISVLDSGITLVQFQTALQRIGISMNQLTGSFQKMSQHLGSTKFRKFFGC